MCIFAVPFGRRGELIELLEDKSTSRNIVATIFEEQAKILLKEDPKPERQMNIQ